MKFTEKYHGYNIDPEYNRNGFGAKYYNGDRYAKPDLIIHKRNCNKYNLLYAEFKVLVREHDSHDKEKIMKFISNDFGKENGKAVKPYKFRFGVSILLGKKEVKMLWFENGKAEACLEYKISKDELEMIL